MKTNYLLVATIILFLASCKEGVELFNCSDFEAMEKYEKGEHYAMFPNQELIRRISLGVETGSMLEPFPTLEVVHTTRDLFLALKVTLQIGNRDTVLYSQYPLGVVEKEGSFYLGYNMSKCKQGGFNNQTILPLNQPLKEEILIVDAELVKVPKTFLAMSVFKEGIYYPSLSSQKKYIEKLKEKGQISDAQAQELSIWISD
jgi:hypothetical protein